jgi:hypothetical protein
MQDGKNPFVARSQTPKTPARPVVSSTPEPEVPIQPAPEPERPVAQPEPQPQPASEQPAEDPGVISWSSVEHTPKKRSGGWYLAWIGVIAALAIAAFLFHWLAELWHFWSTVGLAIIIFITLIVINRQPNRTVNYELSETRISIDGKALPLSDFRAFSVNNIGTWVLSLIPVKRVSLSVDIAIPPDRGEQIVDFLGKILPMEQTGANFAERFSETLKF